jgi:hypothetical protein
MQTASAFSYMDAEKVHPWTFPPANRKAWFSIRSFFESSPVSKKPRRPGAVINYGRGKRPSVDLFPPRIEKRGFRSAPFLNPPRFQKSRAVLARGSIMDAEKFRPWTFYRIEK